MAQSEADRQKDLEERLAFETLLADLSSRFVNLPAEQIDRAVEEAQRRICECLGLDLSALWQGSMWDPYNFTLTHVYRPLGGPPVPERMDARETFPWALQKVQCGEPFVIVTANLPPEAARDRETWRHYGIKSSLVVPLSAGGGPVIGVLSFDAIRTERAWPEPLVTRLKLVAQVFTNALARKTADQTLRASEARLRLAAASADAGLWSLEPNTGRLWATDKARELFHIPPDEPLTFERFLTFVRPEDRERVRQTVVRAMKTGQAARVEYRTQRPDGDLRWIASWGHVHAGASGEPDHLMGVSIDITDRKNAEEHLRQTLTEVQQLRDQLQQQNRYLQEQVKRAIGYDAIVGESPLIRRVLARVGQVAPTDTVVLITGETGTGKELLAHAIHDLSRRRQKPLVTVNCAALPPTLIESELFGREKGAYTGAATRQIGRFEVAHGSTIFLDEISDLPLELQAKLLRVLESGQFERLGSTRTQVVDVRILAAANRDLLDMVQVGTFRADLFYRLNVFPINVPPLRNRREDIPLLVWQFVRHFARKMGKAIESISPETMDRLHQHDWPGNIRELRNVIERAMIVSDTRVLQIEIPPSPPVDLAASGSLEEMERLHIRQVLDRTGWRISGKNGAAEQLGLPPTSLHSKLKRLGISRPHR
jgi:formate hydrogenlyase transcriptional activator